MCVASPEDGREWLDRLSDDHFSSPTAARARTWIRDHLDEPTQGLARDDSELVSYVTQVKMQSEREPASPQAMELSFLELELARIEARIAAIEGDNGAPPVDLQRRRADLTEQIARAQS